MKQADEVFVAGVAEVAEEEAVVVLGAAPASLFKVLLNFDSAANWLPRILKVFVAHCLPCANLSQQSLGDRQCCQAT